MIEPMLVAMEAAQKHGIVLTTDRASELAEECDNLLGAMRQLRPMLSFDDAATDYQRALLESATPRSPGR